MKLFVAVPLLDELENMPKLLNCLRNQMFRNFEVWFCVNQPDDWHNLENKAEICRRNDQTLDLLRSIDDISIHILDYATKGNGWKGKKQGVGWARKVLMDSINEVAEPNDIIVSLDADTEFEPDYFLKLSEIINQNPSIPAFSVSYYHRLTGEEPLDRAILRYEIYMRYYELNLRRIGSPYSFTALGSAMVCRVEAYRAIGGMTPKTSGEDFYFLQKMAKYRTVMSLSDIIVFPAARFSDRVFFGTGPAIIKGASGDWGSYPIYRFELFDEIELALNSFEKLYFSSFPLSIDLVLEPTWSDKLRMNSRTKEVFVKACHDKFDGLRTLQFLKQNHNSNIDVDEKNLLSFAYKFYPQTLYPLLLDDFNFASSPINRLQMVRDFLFNNAKKLQ